MMPVMDGIEVCELIRKEKLYDDVLICFLTARNEDYSQVAGLDAGADDYIAKPLKPKVLISRINALFRRNGLKSRKTEDNNGLRINREKYIVTLNNEVIHLPRKEFELLVLLNSRSEEHTSELQSRPHLVCRLLLEKKKKKQKK